MLWFAKRFAEVSAHEVLVSQFCSDGGATECPVEVAVEVHAEDVGAVIVERILVGSVAEEFEAVFAVIPVDRRFQMERSVLVLRLYCGVCLERVLKLVVPFHSVEGVRPVVLRRDSGMPFHEYVLVAVVTLIECLSALVVGIQRSCLVAAVSVAACVAARQLVVPIARLHVSPCSSREIAVAATLHVGRHAALLPWARHDVDGSHKR